MSKVMPAEKVLMGMATHGYDWPKDTKATSVTAQKPAQLRSNYQVQSHWDEESYSPYYTYWDEQGRYHEVWLENHKSLTAKWEVVTDYNLEVFPSGVSAPASLICIRCWRNSDKH